MTHSNQRRFCLINSKLTVTIPRIRICPMLFHFVAAMIFLTMIPTGEAAAAGDTQITVNPYADVDWDLVEHYKMNLHTHTTESDGRLSPQEVIDAYHARAYHGLIITDHDRNTWPWTAHDRDPEALGMLAIPGNELSRHHHTLSLFSTYETEERDHDKALAGVAEAGGLAILCHPAMHWLRDFNQTPSLQVPLAPALRTMTQNDFCIEAWFRTTDSGRNILAGNFSPNYSGAFNLELHTENRVRLYLQSAEDGRTVDLNVQASSLGIDTRDGQWHHLAAVRRDGVNYLYLDGRLARQAPDRAGSFALQGDFFFIGRDSRTGDTAFAGDLAHLRLWRRGLSGEDIAALAKGMPLSNEGLLAQYAAPQKADRATASFADTSGSREGPFDAEAVGSPPPLLVADGPLPTAEEDVSGALRFGPAEFPQTVPEAAIGHYAALFKRHPHLVGIEVLNRTRPDREYPLDRALWDHLLTAMMPQRPIWGVAVDDMHGLQHLGGDWVVLPAQKLDEETARDALKNGRYYFASTRLHDPASAEVNATPRIERIRHDAATGVLVIEATVAGEALPEDAYVWISGGKTVHSGATLPYRETPGIDGYVRAEITGQGGTVYTNPFGFKH
jgi:hypothetical protein